MYDAWSCQNVCDALTFFGQRFYSIWHQAVWTGSWDSYGHLLCSPGCRFFPVLFGVELYDVFLMISMVMLLMLLTLHPDIWINNVCFDNMVSQIYPS